MDLTESPANEAGASSAAVQWPEPTLLARVIRHIAGRLPTFQELGQVRRCFSTMLDAGERIMRSGHRPDWWSQQMTGNFR